MRTDIEFRNEDGITLRGWHYVPDNGSGPFPTIILAHGFSAVKEMYLDKFAEAFAVAGMASIVFDHRNFGASGGEIRQDIDPWCQIRDYRDAITFAETLPQTDASKIGVWGSSYSGGARPRRGSNRQESESCRSPGSADQWPRQCPQTDQGRLHRRISESLRGRPPGAVAW